jgi:hypothetical protein
MTFAFFDKQPPLSSVDTDNSELDFFPIGHSIEHWWVKPQAHENGAGGRGGATSSKVVSAVRTSTGEIMTPILIRYCAEFQFQRDNYHLH